MFVLDVTNIATWVANWASIIVRIMVLMSLMDVAPLSGFLWLRPPWQG
jgi:hypothetical protein